MSPGERLAGGLLLLAAYAWALPGAPVSSATAAADGFDSIERTAGESQAAYDGQRFAEALAPTEALVRTFPTQHVYAERLARIHQNLNRPADEAAAWRRFVDYSPTPEEACPAMPNAYDRMGAAADALEAFARCVTFAPRDPDMHFYLGLANERRGLVDVAAESCDAALVPAHTDAAVGLARLRLREGDLDAAEMRATVLEVKRSLVDRSAARWCWFASSHSKS